MEGSRTGAARRRSPPQPLDLTVSGPPTRVNSGHLSPLAWLSEGARRGGASSQRENRAEERRGGTDREGGRGRSGKEAEGQRE
eukprot:1784654-Rhodomonas_salina.1